MLYLACTRGPRTRGGVPAGLCYLNIFGCWLGYIFPGDADLTRFFGGWIWIFLCAVGHLLLMWGVTHDPNITRVLHKRLDAGWNIIHWSAPYRVSPVDVTSAV